MTKNSKASQGVNLKPETVPEEIADAATLGSASAIEPFGTIVGALTGGVTAAIHAAEKKPKKNKPPPSSGSI